MNEWGVPDWRDAADYGQIKRWTKDRWRWEFRRRRDDLRQYFDRQLERSLAQGATQRPGRPQPHQPGFAVPVDAEAKRRFGCGNWLPNPRIGDQPEWVIRTFEPFESNPAVIDESSQALGNLLDLEALNDATANLVRTGWAAGLVHEVRDLMESSQGHDDASYFRTELVNLLAHCRLVHLREGEVALIFNLGDPLRKQLEGAGRLLRDYQKRLHGQQLQSRKHPNKWLACLRALDARADGASYAEMAQQLFADGILDRQRDPSGGYCEPPPQAARDLWEQADRLRFNF